MCFVKCSLVKERGMLAQTFTVDDAADAFYLSKNIRKAFGRFKMIKEQATPIKPITRWSRRHHRHLHHWDPDIIARMMLSRGERVVLHHYYTPDNRIQKLVMRAGKEPVWAVKLFTEDGRFILVEDKTNELFLEARQ